MKLEIITPDENIFSGEADSVVVPGIDGELGVLNNHAPLISALKAGDVRVMTGGKDERFPVNGGVIEVLQNKVIILAD